MEPPMSDNTYVQDLPAGIESDLVKQIFGQYGATVVQCRVLNERAQDGKVHALVRFSSADEAAQVVEKLNMQRLQGLDNPIRIRFANPAGSGGDGGSFGMWKGHEGGKGGGPYIGGKGKPPGPGSLYIAGLPPECEKPMLLELFSQFGTVVRTTMLKHNGHPSGKRAALVEYSTGEEAQQVIAMFHNQVIPGLLEPIQIEFNYAAMTGGQFKPASPYGGGDGSKGGFCCVKGGRAAPTMARGPKSDGRDDIETIIAGLEASGALPGGTSGVNDEKALVITGLPSDTTDGSMYRICAPFGAIIAAGAKAVLKNDGSCNGTGYVSFATDEAVQNCITVLNGCVLPTGETLTVKARKEHLLAIGKGVPQQGGKGGASCEVGGKGGLNKWGSNGKGGGDEWGEGESGTIDGASDAWGIGVDAADWGAGW